MSGLSRRKNRYDRYDDGRIGAPHAMSVGPLLCGTGRRVWPSTCVFTWIHEGVAWAARAGLAAPRVGHRTREGSEPGLFRRGQAARVGLRARKLRREGGLACRGWPGSGAAAIGLAVSRAGRLPRFGPGRRGSGVAWCSHDRRVLHERPIASGFSTTARCG